MNKCNKCGEPIDEYEAEYNERLCYKCYTISLCPLGEAEDEVEKGGLIMDIEEVKKILRQTVTIGEQVVTNRTDRWDPHTGELREDDIDELALQICQLSELKLPENPYPQGDFRWGVFAEAVQRVKELNK